MEVSSPGADRWRQRGLCLSRVARPPSACWLPIGFRPVSSHSHSRLQTMSDSSLVGLENPSCVLRDASGLSGQHGLPRVDAACLPPLKQMGLCDLCDQDFDAQGVL